jgi:uncharacterized protein YndB with AHSA1/START domain
LIEILADGLRIVRRVRAPRIDVFDAWVNPERLRAWFGPVGTSLIAVEGELGVGEEYRLSVRQQDGHVDQLVWRFREVAPPERLVFTWGSGAQPGGSETVVTINFRDRGAFTEIELEHTGVQTDPQRKTFTVGWEGCFQGLERYYTK